MEHMPIRWEESVSHNWKKINVQQILKNPPNQNKKNIKKIEKIHMESLSVTFSVLFHSPVSIHTSPLIIISIMHVHVVENISYLVQHDTITAKRRTAPSLPSFKC